MTIMKPSDFIGSAARVAKGLDAKCDRLKQTSGTLKILMHGLPGVGKTAIAQMVAEKLSGSPFNVESLNGRSLNVELIRAWQQQAAYRPIFGGFTVKIVDELDTAPPAAQDLLLTYLDEMKEGHAFIATSNMDISAIAGRLQTRMQTLKLENPSTEEIAAHLRRLEKKLPPATANQIAVGSGGNVRAAMLDLESWQDFR